MHVTTKGQITIPQNIRETFGFLPHSNVIFKIENDRVYLEKAKDSHPRGKSLIRQMRGKGNIRMSTNEILALTRK